jgi:hypothetical protein
MSMTSAKHAFLLIDLGTDLELPTPPSGGVFFRWRRPAVAKTKKTAQSQAARLLEKAKAAGAAEKGFQRSMGKITLAKQGRKASRMG